MIRVGRCAAIDGDAAIGEAAVVEAALGADGVSRALGAGRSTPDPGLTAALARAVQGSSIVIAGADLPPARKPGAGAGWAAAGARAFDLETGALFALGERLGVAVAAAVVIAEGPGAEAVEETLEPTLLSLGDACLAALFGTPGAAPEAAARRG